MREENNNEARESITESVPPEEIEPGESKESESEENNLGENNLRSSASPEGNYVNRYGRETRPIERYGDLAAMALTQAEFGYQSNLKKLQ